MWPKPALTEETVEPGVCERCLEWEPGSHVCFAWPIQCGRKGEEKDREGRKEGGSKKETGSFLEKA